jgi:hypothetical protein
MILYTGSEGDNCIRDELTGRTTRCHKKQNKQVLFQFFKNIMLTKTI